MSSRRLAPGVRVVRRGRDQLQVGILPGHRAVLPRTQDTEQALADLAAARPVDDAPVPLAEAGLLVPETRAPAVRVAGSLPPLDAEALLRSWGVLPGGYDAPVLVLASGEVPREDVDPLVRRGVPHLVVRLLDGAAVVGPFVDPGSTACLRCTDAALAQDDPEHATVVQRYLLAPPGPPPDPALATLALAWAVRDLRAHAEGGRPSTWSRTWQLGPSPAAMTSTTWARHPLCGCTWTDHVHLAGTMEP